MASNALFPLDYSEYSEDEFMEKFDPIITKQHQNMEDSKSRLLDLEVIIPSLELSRGGKLLEVGVGEGNNLHTYGNVLRVRGGKYFGNDIDPDAVNSAKSRAEDAGINPQRLYLINPGRYPHSSESIDQMMAVTALHESPDVIRDFREMDRVLKRGGVITIVERPTSQYETEDHKKNLQNIPSLIQDYFSSRYKVDFKKVKMSYWGTCMEPPQFTFYRFKLTKK